VQPQALTRPAQRDIREVLGNSALSGARLAGAIRQLGVRHGIAPFRACLGAIALLHRSERDSEKTIQSIEEHRAGLRRSLNRDPGFGVAALDYLQQVERMMRGPVSMAAAPSVSGGAGRPLAPTDASVDQILVREIARCERAVGLLALCIVRPDRPLGQREATMTAAARVLHSGLRDIDYAARLFPDGFAIIMPCTPGKGAAGAMARLRAALTGVTGLDWSAGIAGCPEIPWDATLLVKAANAALEQVRQRGGTTSMLQRAERRAHRRWMVGADQLSAAIRYGAGETEIVVEDLSLGGARLTTRRPIPQGDRVTLSLAAAANRARRTFIDARVVRIDEAEGAYTAPTFRAGLEFLPDEAVHSVIRTMIDGLTGAGDPRAPAR
jgi:hypothetical protein